MSFLDEPTTGVDVGTRRFIWDRIKDGTRHAVVLLTTHYMDEADILGDAIAIMARGVVKCVGSSLFLKKRFGGGFRLSCEREAGAGPASDHGVVDSAGVLLSVEVQNPLANIAR